MSYKVTLEFQIDVDDIRGRFCSEDCHYYESNDDSIKPYKYCGLFDMFLKSVIKPLRCKGCLDHEKEE